jgi:hypothetical protein
MGYSGIGNSGIGYSGMGLFRNCLFRNWLFWNWLVNDQGIGKISSCPIFAILFCNQTKNIIDLSQLICIDWICIILKACNVSILKNVY